MTLTDALPAACNEAAYRVHHRVCSDAVAGLQSWDRTAWDVAIGQTDTGDRNLHRGLLQCFNDEAAEAAYDNMVLGRDKPRKRSGKIDHGAGIEWLDRWHVQNADADPLCV